VSTPLPTSTRMHIVVDVASGRTVCGLDARRGTLWTVGPRQAHHATCKRCVRGLQRP
jgi:hypothetical protein